MRLESGYAISLLERDAWEQSMPDSAPLEPEEERQESLEKIHLALAETPKNIIEKDDYLDYLHESLDTHTKNDILNPHKAIIQYEMARRNINENDTRVVTMDDPSTLLHYTLHLLKTHKEVWWSTAEINDFTDPQGEQNAMPPLFKHITMENLVEKFGEWNRFAKNHQNAFAKVFPQDGKDPALCSLILVKNDRLTVKIRPGQYSTNERNEHEKPVVFDIDLHGKKPIVILEKAKDAHWVHVLLNSIRLFQKLDDINLTGSDYVQPECMAYGDGIAKEFAFFTDIIWGTKKRSNVSNKTICPKFAPIIEELPTAKVVIRNKNRKAYEAITHRYAADEELSSLKSDSKLDALHDTLKIVESGDWPNNELVIRLLAQGLQGSVDIPKSAEKIITLSIALRLFKTASTIVHGPEGDFAILPLAGRNHSTNSTVAITWSDNTYLTKSEKKRLERIETTRKRQIGQSNVRINMLTMADERLNVREILELLYLLRTGKLHKSIMRQHNEQIEKLSKKLPTISTLA